MAGVPEVASLPVVARVKGVSETSGVRADLPLALANGGVRVCCLFAFFVRRLGISCEFRWQTDPDRVVFAPTIVQVRLDEKAPRPRFLCLYLFAALKTSFVSSSPANAGRDNNVGWFLVAWLA